MWTLRRLLCVVVIGHTPHALTGHRSTIVARTLTAFCVSFICKYTEATWCSGDTHAMGRPRSVMGRWVCTRKTVLWYLKQFISVQRISAQLPLTHNVVQRHPKQSTYDTAHATETNVLPIFTPYLQVMHCSRFQLWKLEGFAESLERCPHVSTAIGRVGRVSAHVYSGQVQSHAAIIYIPQLKNSLYRPLCIVVQTHKILDVGCMKRRQHGRCVGGAGGGFYMPTSEL